ncbi:HAMP domain-containing protein [Paenibacillus psychroresistens]|uniref:histidine kinase n=1 Tax=Paenibacillus psychroresistens TaxID=1778678 RepID=A0A6B8RNX4_9BACL|nr:histidine kinase [Paenibacillus psychroresistens]QGQ97719.1 HAMP domain-containing protein [Paenibacillus psychroresistens]
MWQALKHNYNKIQKRISDFKIGFKIALFYLMITIISISVSSYLYQKIYLNVTLSKVSEVSVQTLNSISSNIDLMMDNVNNYSQMVIANNDLQEALRNGSIYLDLNTQRRVRAYLIQLIQAIPSISSVYIFDQTGNKYSVGNLSANNFKLNSIQEAVWYNEVIKANGAYILRLNGEGAFEIDPDKNFISLIRVVRDLESIKPIGILIINVPEQAFIQAYSNILNNYKTDIVLLDEHNKSIVKKSESNQYDLNRILSKFNNQKSGYKFEAIMHNKYLVSYLKENKYGLKIVSFMPFKELLNETVTMIYIGVIIILINSILLFIGSIFIARMITIPIKKLLKSMKGIENNEFNEVKIKAGNNELGRLRDGYNIMIQEIQKQIKNVIEEQRIKRKAELNVLQAQIKPHFLYNTLDSITSLAISERVEDVCQLTDALGSYYRTSLSNGKEIITIKEEIELVKNYLIIQKIRYGEMFSVTYDIDGRVVNNKILKLVLQPLAENALYHGIKAMGEPGSIKISAKYDNHSIRLIVEDDGVGMSTEKITNLLGKGNESTNDSFGIRGTIERLRIFYGQEDLFRIESKPGSGTKVTITIPFNVHDNEGELR